MQRRIFLLGMSGAALAAPLHTLAQTRAPIVIGYLDSTNPTTAAKFTAAFRDGLKNGGLIEGRDVIIEHRWAEGQFARLPDLANELINKSPAVMVCTTLPAVLAGKTAIQGKIPMVFAVSADPIEFKIVSRMNSPEGNITGVSQVLGPLGAKRVEIMNELVPGARNIGILTNPKNPHGSHHTHSAMEAVKRFNLKAVVLEASDAAEVEQILSSKPKVDAILVADDPIFRLTKDKLLAAVTRLKVPAIYFGREFVDAGGLISYGPHFPTLYYKVGQYTAQILKGAKTSDLPVVQPDRFELVINAKAAKVLRIALPNGLRVRADEVIA